METPQWLDDSLNFQFNGIVVVSPGGIIPPFGTKASGPAKFKVMWTGSNILIVNHEEWFYVGPFPFPPFDSWTCRSWLIDTQQAWIECCFSTYTASQSTLPQPAKVLPLGECSNWLFQTLLHHASSWLLQDGGKYGTTSDACEYRPTDALP